MLIQGSFLSSLLNLLPQKGMVKMDLRPCPFCGRKPIIEHWSSGGIMYMVKCNNPDCPVPVNSYPTGRNLNDVEDEWNKRSDNDKL